MSRFWLLLLLWPLLASAAPLPQVVIIIDDVGNSLPLGERATRLPAPINLAVLPFRPNGAQLARQGFKRGHEIMLHAPMSNMNRRPLGLGGLTPYMDRDALVGQLRRSIDSIPHISGVNNHMGSALTRMPLQMSWVMEELKAQQLFFVDSRTTHHTVAEQMAATVNIPHLRRDVFLDHFRRKQDVDAAFEELLKRAQQQGIAVGIGHPHPETLSVLEEKLPALLLRGFQLITASQASGSRSESTACVTLITDHCLFTQTSTQFALSAKDHRKRIVLR